MTEEQYNKVTSNMLVIFMGIMLAILILFVLTEHAADRRHKEVLEAISKREQQNHEN
jgi:surface polysaccharide O-acyltransferase-like enzyme